MGHSVWRIVLMVGLLGCWASRTLVAQDVLVLFAPFDEAASVPDLVAARGAILGAVRDGDIRALEKWLASDFNGSAHARRADLEALSKDRRLLDLLGELLEYGGAFIGSGADRFCAPYWVARPPDVTHLPDEFQFEGLPWVVITSGTPVYSQPSDRTPQIGILQHQLIKVFSADDVGGPFAPVEFRGARGYVNRSAIRDPNVKQRTCFERRDGSWQLTTFQAY